MQVIPYILMMELNGMAQNKYSKKDSTCYMEFR